jgi:hypothetical protein
MRYLGLLIFWMVFGATTLSGQDSIKPKSFEYSKLKPIVHFFANSEYNASQGVDKDYSFWLGRAMFGFQYQYDKHWSGTLLIDRTRLTGSMNTMYIKFASLSWSPNDRFTLEGGAVKQNNYIPFETLWGYRFIAEAFQDRYYAIPSSDLGLLAGFKISKTLAMDVSITNGEGPRIDQDNFGRLKFAGGLDFKPDDHLQTRIFYHLKTSGEAGLTAKEQLFNAFAGYRSGERYRIGAEINYVSGYQNNPDFVTYGGTIFGCVTIYKNLKFMGRYDRIVYDIPDNLSTAIYVNGNAFITGLILNPIKGINVSLNYQGFYSFDDQTNPTHRVLFSFEYRL